MGLKAKNLLGFAVPLGVPPGPEFLQVEVGDGSEIEGEDLGDDESSDDDEAEGAAGLGCHAAQAHSDGDGSHEG